MPPAKKSTPRSSAKRAAARKPTKRQAGRKTSNQVPARKATRRKTTTKAAAPRKATTKTTARKPSTQTRSTRTASSPKRAAPKTTGRSPGAAKAERQPVRRRARRAGTLGQRIVDHLATVESAGAHEVAKAVKATRESVGATLSHLNRNGRIRRISHGRYACRR
jgi:hypothetical protein